MVPNAKWFPQHNGSHNEMAPNEMAPYFVSDALSQQLLLLVYVILGISYWESYTGNIVLGYLYVNHLITLNHLIIRDVCIYVFMLTSLCVRVLERIICRIYVTQ